MDIQQQVLAAFQTEHKEHVEAIRALLSELQPGDDSCSADRLDEAFRLAHTIKGGARVCDLRPAETLGHQLESLFDQVRQGTRTLDQQSRQTVAMILDALEDWMAALDGDGPPPNIDPTLDAIARRLENNTPTASAPMSSDEVTRLVRAVFQEEYREYVDKLRPLVARLADEGPSTPRDLLQQGFRLAHNLQSAASAACLDEVQQLSQQLEDIFGRSLDGDPLTEQDAAQAESLLEAICQAALTHREESTAADSFCIAATAEDVREASPQSATSTVGTRHIDTFRIRAESLDHLVRASGQLLTDVLDLRETQRSLDQFCGELDAMRRNRDAVRHLTAASLHRLANQPEFARVVKYFDAVDREIGALARRARQLSRLHDKNVWQLEGRGREIHDRARDVRMIPAEGVLQGLRKLARDLARDEGKQLDFDLSGLDQRADRLVLQAIKDPLMHMVRNAIVHGIETPQQRLAAGKSEVGHVRLALTTVGSRLRITLEDDGRGIDGQHVARQAVRHGLLDEYEARHLSHEQTNELIFRPGLSTAAEVSELSGRGMGLSVVQKTLSRLHGTVRINETSNQGTRFELSIPLSISTHRLLLFTCAGQRYAVPVPSIERLLRVKLREVETLEGKPVVTLEGRPISLVGLAAILQPGHATSLSKGDSISVIVLRLASQRVAIAVDALLSECDAIIHELTGPAAQTAHFSGAILLGDGCVALVLDPARLTEEKPHNLPGHGLPHVAVQPKPASVLVVDDSFTTRTVEKSILEAHGYVVATAVDGQEALVQLRSRPFDLVISDIEMPGLDGFELLERIKADAKLKTLPVILLTSRDRAEDRDHGMTLGADAYIVKQRFDHQDLIETIKQIL